MLTPYRKYAPTSFDIRGLNCEDQQDWLVAPCGQNRDSDTLAEANFAAQLAALREVDPSGTDHEIHRFGHWACGWFEIVLTRPESKAAKLAEDLAGALENYPSLNDDRWSRLEFEKACDVWQHFSLRDRIRACAKYGASIFAARREEIPEDRTGELVSYLGG